MKYLFIGGIADGERNEVPDGRPHWQVSRVPEGKWNPGKIIPLTAYATQQTYRAYSFGAGPFAFRVFIPTDWDSAEVLAALIDGYRRPKE